MKPEEKAILVKIREGNSFAFEGVFTRYYPRLCAYAFSLVRQHETAEDLVKDVFTRLWLMRREVAIETSLSAYLYRGVYHACINHLTRDQARRNQSIPIDENPYYSISANDNVIALLEARETEAEIYRQIEKLPPQCREIFQMSRFGGLSYAEIATKLNISENTVKVQVSRALEKLRTALRPLWYLLLPML